LRVEEVASAFGKSWDRTRRTNCDGDCKIFYFVISIGKDPERPQYKKTDLLDRVSLSCSVILLLLPKQQQSYRVFDRKLA
jgi:hypothetical protein